MRALLCGSRTWDNVGIIEEVIAGLYTIAQGASEFGEPVPLTIIHGDAPGADRLAGSVAEEFGCEVIAVPAEWDKYGRSAGPKRNQKMLDEYHPSVVYAFRKDGESRGTDDMISRARKAGALVRIVFE